MRITIVAGARPNFMKIAPIIKAVGDSPEARKRMTFRLVHTGQHYDEKLSKIFFEQLHIPQPDINLGVGSGTQAEQTARIMVEFEKELQKHPTDLVIVVGDVTSTMACTIVAKKLGAKVAHVEGGIRSFDMSMPEEINRIVTDSLADYFFTTTEIANQNLINSGVWSENIFLVGNTMIDSLVANLQRIQEPSIINSHKLKAGEYYVVTLHRPSNVDDVSNLENILRHIQKGSDGSPVVFPVHPRTKAALQKSSWKSENIILTEPLSYLEFLYLLKSSMGVITDSGGIQEETTYLGVPCITLRKNTERPETIDLGTNVLCPEIEQLRGYLNQIQKGAWKKGAIPPLWDGKTSERIVERLLILDER